MTQHEKILNLCAGERWVCQSEFWQAYIFSPHKRRAEIAKKSNGRLMWEERPCDHGIDKSKDFRLLYTNPPELPRETIPVEPVQQSLIEAVK